MPNGAVVFAFFRLETTKVAVVGKQPVFAQYFADEGVGVGQADAVLGSLADVGDDVGGFDLVGFYHKLGHRRVGAGLIVVSIGRPAAQAEFFKGENDVDWGVAVHAPQAVHDEFLEISW